MSQKRSPEEITATAEVDEVIRLLAQRANSPMQVPSSDAIYWRARARLALEESQQRQQRAVRPVRLLHLALGVTTIAAAAVMSVWPLYAEAPSSGVETLLATLLITMTSLGAHFLAESRPQRST